MEFLEEHNKTRSHLHNLNTGGSVVVGRGRQSGGAGGSASGSSGGRGADVVVID